MSETSIKEDGYYCTRCWCYFFPLKRLSFLRSFLDRRNTEKNLKCPQRTLIKTPMEAGRNACLQIGGLRRGEGERHEWRLKWSLPHSENTIHFGPVVVSGAHRPHHPIHCCVVNSCVHVCCFLDYGRNEASPPPPMGKRKERRKQGGKEFKVVPHYAIFLQMQRTRQKLALRRSFLRYQQPPSSPLGPCASQQTCKYVVVQLGKSTSDW